MEWKTLAEVCENLSRLDDGAREANPALWEVTLPLEKSLTRLDKVVELFSQQVEERQSRLELIKRIREKLMAEKDKGKLAEIKQKEKDIAKANEISKTIEKEKKAPDNTSWCPF